MKIVINTCYGEFGISIEALQELVSRSAKCLRICTPKYYYGGENGWNKRHDWEKGWQRDFATYKDLGNGMMAHPYGFNIFKDGFMYLLEYKNRTDNDLIEIVETMGQKANGVCACLKVVEIPDGINWEIDEHDGFEIINEAHRSWC